MVEKGPIFAVRFSPTGRWLLTASLDGSWCIGDVREKRLHRQVKVHKGMFSGVAHDSAHIDILVLRVEQTAAWTPIGCQIRNLSQAGLMVLSMY